MSLVKELRWRGLIQDIMPNTEAYLEKNKVKGYVGFDPTGDSLHIGSLVPIILLIHLQKYGHTPIALVGGATGMIGDPSGKSKERQFLTEEKLRYNESCIHAQLSRFLDFHAEGNPAEIVNNYDWFKEMNFLDFLREVGKYLTINYMKAKDSVKNRIESEQGISFTEFTYQLVQGYDFYHLYKTKGVLLQMGGGDQWGNITTGTELTRKKEGHEVELQALTAPLIARSDGTKFGKTAEGENIWIDAKRTSFYNFYQYWLNVSDDDAIKYIKIFTFLSQEKIESLIAQHEEAKHLRLLQKELAVEVTTLVHGEAGLQNALSLTDFFWGGKISPESLAEFSAESWEEISNVLSENDRKNIESEKVSEISIVDFLVETKILSSKTEARRAVKDEKSIALNGNKITDIEHKISVSDAFHGKYFFVQKGKKGKFLVEV